VEEIQLEGARVFQELVEIKKEKKDVREYFIG